MLPALAEKALEWLLLFLSLLQYLSDFHVSLSPIRTETMLSPFSKGVTRVGFFQPLGLEFPSSLSRDCGRRSKALRTVGLKAVERREERFAVDLGSKHPALYPTFQGLKRQRFMCSNFPPLSDTYFVRAFTYSSLWGIPFSIQMTPGQSNSQS